MRFRLSVLMFLQWAVPGSLIPLLSAHLDGELGFSRLQTALCCATQAAGAVLSSLVAGHVADRWVSAEKAMAACAAVAGVALWLIAGLSDPAAVLLATLLFWVAAGPMLLMGTTVCFTHLAEPGRQFGPVRLWGTVGWVCMSWLVTAWLELAGRLLPGRPGPPLADSFRLGGLAAFALAGFALTLPRTPPRPGVTGPGLAPLQVIRLLRGRSFAVYCLCVVGSCLTFPLSTQNTPLLLAQRGVAPSRLTAAQTFSQSTEIVLLAFLPALLSRLGLRAMMALGLAAWLAALSALALGLPTVLVVPSLALNGVFVTGFLIAGQVYVNGLADDGLRASAQGVLSWVNGLGLLAGNLLAGGLREANAGALAPTFAAGAAVAAAMLVLFLAGFRAAAGPPPRGSVDG